MPPNLRKEVTMPKSRANQDRYLANKNRDTQFARQQRARRGGLTERQAERRAASGEEFVCVSCQAWKKRHHFEYVYPWPDGETHLARRCQRCRDDRRHERRNRNRR